MSPGEVQYGPYVARRLPGAFATRLCVATSGRYRWIERKHGDVPDYAGADAIRRVANAVGDADTLRIAWPRFTTATETWYPDVSGERVAFDHILTSALRPELAPAVDDGLGAFGSFLGSLHTLAHGLSDGEAGDLTTRPAEPWGRCGAPLGRAVSARVHDLEGLLPRAEPSPGNALLHGRSSLSLLAVGSEEGDLQMMGWREISIGAPHDDVAWPVFELAEIAAASSMPATWLEGRLDALLGGYTQAGGRSLNDLARDGLGAAVGRRLCEHGAIQLEIHGWNVGAVRQRLLHVWNGLRTVCPGVG